MNWLYVKNAEPFPLGDIPSVPIEELCEAIADRIYQGMRPVQFFGRPVKNVSGKDGFGKDVSGKDGFGKDGSGKDVSGKDDFKIAITAVLADDRRKSLLVSVSEILMGRAYGEHTANPSQSPCPPQSSCPSQSPCPPQFSDSAYPSYPSITPRVPSFHAFERELFEQTGIRPLGHPWLKGLRFERGSESRVGRLHDYPYLQAEGAQMHEVAVGPVHAGVIEPGSFRFLCHGEDVMHLEIQLGYQHRGIEKLFIDGGLPDKSYSDKSHLNSSHNNNSPLGNSPQKNSLLNKSHLAESIAGDTVIGHGWAYALVVEALSGARLSGRAETIRAVALELERIAMHLSGLAGMSLDVGYLPGASVYGRLRTSVINTTLALCGCRFGRGLIRPGGVLFDVGDDLCGRIKRMLDTLEHDVEMMNSVFFNSPSVLSRLEHTGVVTAEDARKVGLVGPMARMTSLDVDSRVSHPIGRYKGEKFDIRVLTGGDARARAGIRAMEIEQSIGLVRRWTNHLTGALKEDVMTPCGPLSPDTAVVSVVEGWRGEVSHMAVTGADGSLAHYKIKDPSFHNWTGLALAVRGGGISDFPLCNKSFDQSYCGFDL
jgi:Ni,Fe-hydrogenase III large subunit